MPSSDMFPPFTAGQGRRARLLDPLSAFTLAAEVLPPVTGWRVSQYGLERIDFMR
ncbi:hypothetical protein GCM10010151_45670 [Actinoallomurus spadix]|uniref:Uncharacterized protein n=1 Tax=Actinoallomurus spadix TaxID=79912 RepID=A0ABN0WYZ7_9ACTN